MPNKRLEKFAIELLKYLYKTKDYDDERLSIDVFVFCNNKKYYVDYNEKNLENFPLRIEENVDVSEYLEFYEKDSLNVIMEGRLQEYLYYKDVKDSDKVIKKVTQIFKKYGYYYDFGTSITLMAKKI